MDYLTINKAAWNKRTKVHVNSRFYDVDGFLAGKSSLTEIETSELPNVTGKTLLHLQCHFGLDTLSWARKGAVVTGVDLSDDAIETARQLAQKTTLDASFICSDVYGVSEILSQQFDIVFTSYGAICWLPDIDRWAKTVAACLNKGGVFYMAEFHPIFDVFSGVPYFYRAEADVEEEGTYTENCDGEVSTVMTWSHPVSNVITALSKAGIDIEIFTEYPFSPYNCFEGLIEQQPNRFVSLQHGHPVPLIYSIKGTKR